MKSENDVKVRARLDEERQLREGLTLHNGFRKRLSAPPLGFTLELDTRTAPPVTKGNPLVVDPIIHAF